jgi:4-hydroxy-3-polyprenylbenzoate decarboxylase
MGYRSLAACVADLARAGHLIRIEEEVDAELEAAEIQRRVFAAGGPAIYFPRVKDCRFPLVCNLFGTRKRVEYLFRDTLAAVERIVKLKVDPAAFKFQPWKYLAAGWTASAMLPRTVRNGPVLEYETTLDQLPRLKSWPRDGGPFITLPQVYTEDPDHPGAMRSNLGMYRVQLSGNQYAANREAGLHYQIHRGIGVHHAAAIRRGETLRASVFVGGPPAMNVAAVMPLPEGFPELAFAGALAGRAVRLIRRHGESAIHADADFCLTGYIDPHRRLPEGPFGDHLGYYSLTHDFPVFVVEHVYHRRGAVWPFTSVGRPPQEDTLFGALIHDITGPVIPKVLPGVKAVHAVDAAGVHPLLLAIGSERYVPYAERRRPQELLTQANAILGQGQMSLAKYLLMVAHEDNPALEIHKIDDFLAHLLARVDWERDLHFQTCTTIDTLDYSGSGFNEGSKVVIAAVGPPRRVLPTALAGDVAGMSLPAGFGEPKVALPGVLVVQGPAWQGDTNAGKDRAVERFAAELTREHPLCRFPLVVIADDSDFTARALGNLLWVTFTRSNPAADIYGVESFTHEKHWGCRGAVVIDARLKPHLAPPLVEDPAVVARVERLAQKGGPLAGIL